MTNFQSGLVVKVLGYYFINPRARHYIRELARLLSLDPGNLSRKMNEFAQVGLFTTVGEGRNRYFMLNNNFPLLKEYKKIYEAENGIPEEIKKVLKKVKGLEEAYIFGSFAKGNFTDSSDIDILLIGDHEIGAVTPKITALERRWHREINIIDLSRQEFAQRKKKKDFLLTEILTNKNIKLI